MYEKKHNGTHHIFGLTALFLSILAALLIMINKQHIIDQLTVWQFQPTSQVAMLADRSGMGSNGRFLFYASRPTVDNAVEFSAHCGGSKEANTAILGCYNASRIHVYDVPNEKLDGIHEVTAAHEMLHAAYDRLDDAEKSRVNKLVEDEYAKLKDVPAWKERVAFYNRSEPGERDNELHSMIGTEVASLSPELEKHYAKYFSDRQKVVALNAKYSAVFEALQKRSKALTAQLNTLADSIEKDSKTYNKDVSALNSDIQAFNQRAKSGNFSSQAQFEYERSVLVSRANALDDRRASINTDIQRFKELKKELESVATESQALNRSLDSSLAPAPSL